MKNENFMKRTIILILTGSALLSTALVSKDIAAEDKKQQDKKSNSRAVQIDKVNANTESLIVKLRGLVCDFCAQALQKVFSKREEISSLSIDLKTKVLTIMLKKGHNLSDETVTKLIVDAGYNLVHIQRKGEKK